MSKTSGNTGWVTMDERIDVLWEDGLPVRVSVRLQDGESLDDGLLEEFLDAKCSACLEYREHVALVGDAGHWEAGETGEMVRSLEIVGDAISESVGG